LIQIPQPVSDLSAIQVGKSIKLSYTLPKLNTDGSAATTLSAIEIYRLISTQVNISLRDAKQSLESMVPWKKLVKDELSKYTPGSKIVVIENLADLPPENLFQSQVYYALRAINNKKQHAGLSNISSVKVWPLPTAPTNLRPSSLGEQYIEIGWESPILRIDGSPMKGPLLFNIYRGVDTQVAAAGRLNQDPVRENHFKDASIELGRRYVYFVRAVDETPGIVESEESQPLEVTNVDTYPPKAPAEVTAVSDGRAISLVWLPNSEPDLAGYWVYRSGSDHNFRRLNVQILTTASTIDKSVEKGQTYFYRIQAVDLQGNESDFSEEVSEAVE
jgi:hypothetical protein